MGDISNETNMEDCADHGMDLTPRDYQSILLETCKSRNTILYLPTGSGKTYIAVMLIKNMSADLKADFSNGGKRTFFMVNTVALVSQQADYIRRHTPLSVGHYSGDMNVDYWTEDNWLEEVDSNQVLVMTCQIFRDILLHNYIRLEDVNLLIFDECHHAVNDHNMRQVMNLFDHCPVEKQPRVLGLTATILNSNCKPHNVRVELETLEKTYRSKVATFGDLSVVQGFSTNPIEKHHSYPERGAVDVVRQAKKYISDTQDFIMECVLEVGGAESRLLNAEIIRDSLKINKKLKNILEDVIYHIDTLGIYGGSLASLKHIIQLERIRSKAEDAKTKFLYLSLITTLNMTRKILEDEMSDCSDKSRIYKYSTPKVLLLLEILRDIKPRPDTSKNLRGIIFVERRFTAKVVYLILKALSEYDEDFNFVCTDFVVGFQNNPFNNTREGALEKKWNSEAIYKFNKGYTNILVSSDVLEEGIDVPQCNLVVRFDVPKSYRSYVQSKGRARHKLSIYAVLIPEVNWEKFVVKFREYQQIENILKDMLARRESPDEDPEEDEEARTEDEQRIYFANGEGSSKVTMNSAIALVNRYCSMLPQDKFTKLAPSFYIRAVTDHKGRRRMQCILQLPINSCVKDIIMGELMLNKRLAKQVVALKTCEALHKAGELDDHLLPRGNEPELIESGELFIMYENEPTANDEPRPGTKKRKRSYMKQFPTALSGCEPQVESPVYLHVIEMKPGYPCPPEDDTRKLAFYNLIQANEGFAILSSKKLPVLCDFPIFLNIGEVDVRVKCNYEKLFLTAEQLSKLHRFNTMVFYDLLKLCKSFMIVDLENQECSYFIVPTKLDAIGRHKIDWGIVDAHPSIPDINEPSDESRINLQVTPEKYQLAVVAPWYRGLLPDQMYVVTKICSDMTPLSPFPTSDFCSFEEYYQSKYKLEIKSPQQPLVEVKAISSKFNCLKPRGGKVSQATSKRKRQELQEDFEEHLVPELCFRYTFPAVLWLKSTCLPSILHRVTHLLLAEELRQNIARELGFTPVRGIEWEPLTVDPSSLVTKEQSKSMLHNATTVNNLLTNVRLGEGVATKVIQSTERQPWGDEKEPIDIDRERLEDLTLMDIWYYDDFISKPLGKISHFNNISELSGASFGSPTTARAGQADGDSSPGSPSTVNGDSRTSSIALLQVEPGGPGPQQYQMLQALTSASANDVINLERLETLGDSFLKFCASLFLFLYYPKVDEGKLTQIKGKMVGNRNLYYCGTGRKLGSIIKVQDFSPKSDWAPPGFCVPRKLQQVLRDTAQCPTFLYELQFPHHEQLQGVLSPDTYEQIETQLLEWDRDSNHSPMETFIGMQSVPDKMVADSVEALIGAYFKGYGVEGAAKLLGWLRVLPPEKADPEWLLKSPPPSAFVSSETNKPEDITHHLPDIEAMKLERYLNYRFKDRSFLLQALTHASYVQNRVTDCYQRLEFLGDAILDFLITCHIYETCDNLSPGELTDLRSSLVNNITFGCLAVRNNFHKFCKYESSKLFDKVDTFVRFQENHNHKVNEDVLILINENDCRLAESVDVPKVLGDLFESLAGAIYLDSGKSLNEVWRVYYGLMREEICEFSKNVPKQPVRMLYEKCQPAPIFQKAIQIQDSNVVMVELELYIGGKKCQFHGFGENKMSAKRAAAKLALKHLP